MVTLQEMKQERQEKTNRVWDYIKNVAESYGFTVEDQTFGGKVLWDESRTVNFTVLADTSETDWENRVCVVRYSISASIAIMGGNPTGEDLQKMGARIASAGAMVNYFNDFPGSLTFRYRF